MQFYGNLLSKIIKLMKNQKLYLDNVSYTDGIATAYMHGKWYLYAVDNDARVVAFELPAIN